MIESDHIITFCDSWNDNNSHGLMDLNTWFQVVGSV